MLIITIEPNGLPAVWDYPDGAKYPGPEGARLILHLCRMTWADLARSVNSTPGSIQNRLLHTNPMSKSVGSRIAWGALSKCLTEWNIEQGHLRSGSNLPDAKSASKEVIPKLPKAREYPIQIIFRDGTTETRTTTLPASLLAEVFVGKHVNNRDSPCVKVESLLSK